MAEPARITARTLWSHLKQCGYTSSNTLQNIALPGNRVAALAGFAQRPFDTRSACFAAIDVTTTPQEDAKACRDLGAPLTFLCHQGSLLWWSQTDRGPYQVGKSIPGNLLEGFFRQHKDDFAPRTIYRAKTLGRFEKTYQRTFVDLGLMPLVEKEAGQAIEKLLLESVAEARKGLGWPQEVSLKQAQWLVQSVFWLLGAKMLHDKGVEGFVRLNFGDVEDVLAKVSAHYGDSTEDLVSSLPKKRALEGVARRVATSADLQLATTEALAYVYENTLISKEVRAEFGTHSTPGYLVDYVIGRLEPWISQIPQDQRSVFEPACGHGAFLIGAIRLLTSLLPTSMSEPAARKKYLRDRVRGYDIDDFAVEIARLSLTLTDIPNTNGWSVKCADLFQSDLIEKASQSSTILLANTPFEDLSGDQRNTYARRFRFPRFVNKSAELLNRAVSAMPVGGVFGFLVPQTLLHESNSTGFRKLLVEQCEFHEISLFPDGVFNFADQEAALLIGKKGRPSASSSFRYRRVRERQMERFKDSYEATNELSVGQSRFQAVGEYDLRVPDLESVWTHLAGLSNLQGIAEIGQGFSHLGEEQDNFPRGVTTVSDKHFKGAVEGFANLGKGIQTHQLPPLRWLNLSRDVVGRPRSGTQQGRPQVLLNQPPVQRAPWCLRAMIDSVGRPAKTSFTILRPMSKDISLEFLWALLNSPIANAYAYSHSSKWNILTGTWREFPVPSFTKESIDRIETAARNYLDRVAQYVAPILLRADDTLAQESIALRDLHWRMDAEVLRCYELPVEIERELLDYFTGCERVGVPFPQDRYFPEGFDEPASLVDFLAITADWDGTNKRRQDLIDRNVSTSDLGSEARELGRLQRLAGLKRELLASPSLGELAELEEDLRRRGIWKGE